MEPLIIQCEAKHGRLVETFRSQGDKVSIGRGYINDLVINDPYVAASQIACHNIDGHWLIRVLDKTNRILLNGKILIDDDEVINSGDTLTIGRTNLKLFSQDHHIEETRKLLSSWLHSDSVGFFLPAIALLCMLIIGFAEYFLTLTQVFEWKPVLLTLFALVGGHLVYSGSRCSTSIPFWPTVID